MKYTWVSLRKLRLIASFFFGGGTNDDMRLGKLEEIEIYCFCAFETNGDMCLGKLEEVDIYCFFFWDTNDDMRLGKLEQIGIYCFFCFGDE